MGQIRHGCATTTHAIRAAIQRSQASNAELSRDLGINPKTVAKWRKRQSVEDRKTGPRQPRSTVLSEEDEAVIVAFRRHTLLPLDDCLYALQPSIPHLTRSALHRCLQRHGISRLPDVGGDKPKRQKFKRFPIGFFHIDIAEVQTAEGKLYLFVGIDRTSKFAVTQLVEKADRRTAWEFLQHMLEAVPYQVHTILTDNGIQFAEQSRNRNTIIFRPMRFDMICEANGIEHRLTKPNHPWTNGQVERMNRTIKDATVKRFHYDSHDQLRAHLADFMAAYNFARRLKTLIFVPRWVCDDPQRRTVMSEIITVRLDLAKNVFQVHGADVSGRAVLRKKLRRDQVLEFFGQIPACVVAMVACPLAGAPI